MDQGKQKKLFMIVIWVIAIVLWAGWKQNFFHHDQHSSEHGHVVRNSAPSSENRGTSSSQQSQGQGRLPLNQVESYVLAFSWEPGFCQSNEHRPECRNASQHPLTLHGFWPGLPQSLAGQGVGQSQWDREGCFIVTHEHEGSFCSFAQPPLSSGLRSQLDSAMPGTQSCLDRHEYAKHGACFNVSADQYFGQALRVYNAFQQSEFGQWLVSQQGQSVSRHDILSHFADSFHTSSRGLTLMCNRDGELTDIRVGIVGDQLTNFPSSRSFTEAGRGRCGAQISL